MNIGQKIYGCLYPPTVQISPYLEYLLKNIYPLVDWEKIIFYDKMPWFLTSSFAVGTALPRSFWGKELGVYCRDLGAMSSVQATLIIVHEAYHIYQYEGLKGGINWGLNCRFMRYYFGWYFQTLTTAIFQKKMPWKQATAYAYRQHPMEVVAYAQENLFYKEWSNFNQNSTEWFIPHQSPLVIAKPYRIPPPKLGFHALASFVVFLLALSQPLIASILYLVAFFFSRFRRN